MTDRISFEHFIRRWAWSPYKGLHRALRPTPQEALDIARSFKRDPDLVMSYISDMTGDENVERMWNELAPASTPEAVGIVISTPLMLRQYASAPDAAAWGRLTRSHRSVGELPFLSRRQARHLIAERVSGDFVETLMRGGLTDIAEIEQMWSGGIPADYALAARSAL